MNLYPAIDIFGGSAVRLVKGDFDEKKVYDEDPLSAARGWTEAGRWDRSCGATAAWRMDRRSICGTPFNPSTA